MRFCICVPAIATGSSPRSPLCRGSPANYRSAAPRQPPDETAVHCAAPPSRCQQRRRPSLCKKTVLFELFLCLSRACLGKMIVFQCTNGSKRPFSDLCCDSDNGPPPDPPKQPPTLPTTPPTPSLPPTNKSSATAPSVLAAPPFSSLPTCMRNPIA